MTVLSPKSGKARSRGNRAGARMIQAAPAAPEQQGISNRQLQKRERTGKLKRMVVFRFL